jgi:hypothetical protein
MVVWNSMLLEILSFPLDVLKQHVRFILPDLNLLNYHYLRKQRLRGCQISDNLLLYYVLRYTSNKALQVVDGNT